MPLVRMMNSRGLRQPHYHKNGADEPVMGSNSYRWPGDAEGDKQQGMRGTSYPRRAASDPAQFINQVEKEKGQKTQVTKATAVMISR